MVRESHPLSAQRLTVRARLALARRSLDQISSWWDKLATLRARVEE